MKGHFVFGILLKAGISFVRSIDILPSEQRTYAIPSDRDFLFGDASIVETHNEKIRSRYQMPSAAGQTRQDNLASINEEELRWISDRGGRFLKLDGNRWYIITLKAAWEEVRQK